MKVQLYNKSFSLSIPVQTPSRTVFRLYDSDNGDTMRIYNLGASSMRFDILTSDYPYIFSYDLIKKSNGDFVLDFSENEIPLENGVYDCALYLNDDPVPMPGKVGLGIMLQDDQYIGIINSSRNAIKVNDTIYENPVFKDTGSALMKIETDGEGNEYIGIDVETGVKLLAAENIAAYNAVTADGHIADNTNPDHKDTVVGIVPAAVDIGMTFTAYDRGLITKSDWTWEDNKPIYLSGTGLSQTQPTSGFIQIVGVAKSATSMVILISAEGINGATWRDGSGVPSNTLGVDGDYYLRTDTSDVYKRTSGTYSIVANIKGAQGIQGIQGIQGVQGIPGVSASLWFYRASTTVGGTPASGRIQWDNATQINSANLLVNHITDDGVDVNYFLKAMYRGYVVIIQDQNDETNNQHWKLSADAVHNTGYCTLPVELVSSSGDGTTNFSNSHQLVAIIQRTAISPNKTFITHSPTTSPLNIDLSTGINHIVDVSGMSGALALTFSNPENGQDYYVEVQQGSTPHEVTAPSIPTLGGTAYTFTNTANAVDGLGIIWNGSAYRLNVGNNYKTP